LARPRKQEGETRTHQLPPVRVTEAELSALENAADMAGMSITEYMRDASLNGGKPKKSKNAQPLVRFLNRTLADLNRVGNNVNQIARQLNRGREHDPHHLDGVLYELTQLVEKISRRL